MKVYTLPKEMLLVDDVDNKEFLKKLLEVQTRLNAPKNRKNTFGGSYYSNNMRHWTYGDSAVYINGYVDNIKPVVDLLREGERMCYPIAADDCHGLIDYGADIVIGTHPHRLQPIEEYNGKYICYSLSNFCFGGNNILSDPDSCIIQCTFIMDSEGQSCVDYKLSVIPYSQTSTRPGNDFCPAPYEWGTEEYYRVLSKLGWSNEDE